MENTQLTPEQVTEKLNTLLTEKTAGFVSKEHADEVTAEIKAELETLKGLEAKSNEIEQVIAKFEGKIEALKEAPSTPVKKLTLGQALAKTYEDNIEDIKGAVEKGGKVVLDVKDTTINADYTGTFNLTDYDAEVDRTVRNRYGILDAVNKGTCSSKFVTYVTQSAGSTGTATTEAEAKTESNPVWAEVSEEVKKIATYVKVSKEMLEDLSFIRGEINSDLIGGLNESIEDALLNGTGVGSVITGLLSAPMGLPTFTGAGFTGVNAIQDANLSDVLRVAKAQIEASNFTPTHVILNPVDVAKLQLTKDSTGNYTYPMYIPLTGALKVAEMTVISSSYIAVDSYIVGDMSRVNVKMREGMALSVGLDQDDFTRNMITILAEARLVQYVKTNQLNAFVTGVIATDIAIIDAP